MAAKKINCGLAVMYVCVYVQYLLQLYEQLNGLQKSIFHNKSDSTGIFQFVYLFLFKV